MSLPGWRSDLVRLWQGLARNLSREERKVGVSHVAIVAGGGVAMHATTARTRRQRLRELLPRTRETPGVRVFRLSRALKPAEEDGLLHAIQRHDRQAYTVGIGTLGALWRRWARRGEDLTLPSCSELAALGYATIGKDLTRGRRASEVLPIDLLRAMADEDWVDVGDLYYPAPLPLTFPDGSPVDLGPAPDMSVFEDTEHLLGEGRYEQFHGLLSILDHQQTLAALPLFETATIASDPMAYMARAPDRSAVIVGEAGAVFAWAADYPNMADSAPLTEGVARCFPHVGPDRTPYEGRPTFSELSERERRLNAAEMIRKAVRVEALMIALESVCREGDHEPSTIAALLQALPSIPASKLSAAERGLARMRGSMPELADTIAGALVAYRALAIRRARLLTSRG